jgi:hypothetical protein
MSATRESSAVLQCHPDTPCAAVESINAKIRADEHGTLTINYVLTGAVERLRVPEGQSGSRVDDLWQHTCFELFVGAQNDAEYYEFNFSPSGEWAAYEFRNYRDGGPIRAEGLDPKISVQRSAHALDLSAKVRLSRWPGFQPDVYLCLGLSAVIEDFEGALSYWALRHPPGRPDFHHADNFILQIEPMIVDSGAIDYTAKP